MQNYMMFLFSLSYQKCYDAAILNSDIHSGLNVEEPNC